MEFAINIDSNIAKQSAYYRSDEWSITTLPGIREIDYEISINKLILSVVDEKIIQIWGYLGDLEWEEFKTIPPVPLRGDLLVSGNFEYGFCYRINNEPYRIMFNKATNCICIGDPLGEGTAVEFIKNCIAVISGSGMLTALWIKLVKPKEL